MTSQKIITAARDLSAACNALTFTDPVAYVYNPLDYAWLAHEQYLCLAAAAKKRVVFLGMNPGPFGMAQTGVPFGEVAAARDWLGINAPIAKPAREHPKRPIDGLACTRSEVSGRRLWGLFSERFDTPKKFFTEHFIINHCPLAFMEDTGRNRTPDKLPAAESAPLMAACDNHLRRVVEILEPEWLIAVGGFAEKRATEALDGINVRIGKILHPSPASPAANRGWAEQATTQMTAQGVW
ncbi:MAG: single-stranded DNA-binding protein [Verrucomicrobia subdivision 3 bacterium]|nr:single-stranded DNA-binding protein [Limisphaerales bacterium]